MLYIIVVNKDTILFKTKYVTVGQQYHSLIWGI